MEVVTICYNSYVKLGERSMNCSKFLAEFGFMVMRSLMFTDGANFLYFWKRFNYNGIFPFGSRMCIYSRWFNFYDQFEIIIHIKFKWNWNWKYTLYVIFLIINSIIMFSVVHKVGHIKCYNLYYRKLLKMEVNFCRNIFRLLKV